MNEEHIFMYIILSSMSINKEGLSAGRSPRGAGFAVAVGPPGGGEKNLRRLPDSALQHLHDGGVNRESGSAVDPLGRMCDFGDEGGARVERVGDFLELQLAATHTNIDDLLGLPLLGDQDLAAAGDGLFGGAAIARLPFCFHQKIGNLEGVAQEQIDEVEHTEYDEAQDFVQQSACHC